MLVRQPAAKFDIHGWKFEFAEKFVDEAQTLTVEQLRAAAERIVSRSMRPWPGVRIDTRAPLDLEAER